jgi:glycosyltransferase involved in cell wall biosynthesis
MLAWHAQRGYEIFLVICPPPGQAITMQQLNDACSVYDNLILCQRDGTLLYHLADSDAPIKELAGVRPRGFRELLGEKDREPGARKLLATVRSFCPDLLAEVLLHLDAVLQPQVFWVNYVFMTRALPLIRPGALKVVDTHDVFSSRRSCGTNDNCALTAKEEAELLGRADLVVAIQPDEAEELHRLVPKKRVVTAGVDFDRVDPVLPTIHAPVVLLVASDNPLNVTGVKDFLRFAWPLVRREVPDAEFRVVGPIGIQLDVDDPGVKVIGPVDDLGAVYADTRVVINPAFAGTGLKVKTTEALCHLRPIVVWPSGVAGLDNEMRALCLIATDWYSFACHVIDLCNTDRAAQALIAKGDEIRQAFSADTVYRALDEALRALHV